MLVLPHALRSFPRVLGRNLGALGEIVVLCRICSVALVQQPYNQLWRQRTSQRTDAHKFSVRGTVTSKAGATCTTTHSQHIDEGTYLLCPGHPRMMSTRSRVNILLPRVPTYPALLYDPLHVVPQHQTISMQQLGPIFEQQQVTQQNVRSQ